MADNNEKAKAVLASLKDKYPRTKITAKRDTSGSSGSNITGDATKNRQSSIKWSTMSTSSSSSTTMTSATTSSSSITPKSIKNIIIDQAAVKAAINIDDDEDIDVGDIVDCVGICEFESGGGRGRGGSSSSISKGSRPTESKLDKPVSQELAIPSTSRGTDNSSNLDIIDPKLKLKIDSAHGITKPTLPSRRYDPMGYRRFRKIDKIIDHTNDTRTGIRYEVRYKDKTYTDYESMYELTATEDGRDKLKEYLNSLAIGSKCSKRKLRTILNKEPLLYHYLD